VPIYAHELEPSFHTILLLAALPTEIGCAASNGNSAWDRAVADPAAAKLARPNAVQYAWHEQERLMFVCLDPCTWQGSEYDNHTTKLADMKLEKLDVEQWMTAAKAWGAKEVMLVCKHTGGFCWWPTETTDYCVKYIPWNEFQVIDFATNRIRTQP
jgi:hypothetical protein